MPLRRLACLALLAYALLVPVALADDEKIFADWKEVEKKGRADIKARAEFWSGKGVSGKDLYWLARMWDKGGEFDKAVEVYEQFLAVPDAPEKNRESAIWNAVQALIRKRAWDKIAPWCERLRKDFPSSPVKHQAFHEQGRAAMMLGEPDKALELFAQGADLGLNAAVIDMAEYQMASGKVEDAKATVAKYIAQAPPGKDKALREVEEAFGMLGVEAPSLESAVSVGRTEAPKSWDGKPTLLYFWHMSTPNYDRDLKLASDLANVFGEHARVIAVSGFNKFNPQTKKVEQDLSEEQETSLWKVYIEQTTTASPPCLVLPDSLKEALHQSANGQLTIVGPDGKIVWFSVNNEGAIYRWLRAQEVLKKLAGG